METTHQHPWPQGVCPLPERAEEETLDQKGGGVESPVQTNPGCQRLSVNVCTINEGICLCDIGAVTV